MKNKIALVIGFGSIGKKHCSILKKLNVFKKIFVLTKQKKINYDLISDLKYLKNINPQYIVIASRTNEHFFYLKKIVSRFKDAIILVEKPLFAKVENFKVKKNKVFVGYNLRFHPVLIYIKKFIKKKKIFSINVNCKSYLPYWRKNIDYSLSNSAKKSYGGGVLLELSHEVDYFHWLFGDIKKIDYSKINKVSNLKIDCEDSALITGRIQNANFTINLDFHSRIPERTLSISSNKFYIKADLLKYKIEIIRENKPKIIKFFNKKDKTYFDQHRAILSKNYKNLCSYKQALKVLETIERIKK